MKISNQANQIEHEYLLSIESQLRRQQSIATANLSKAQTTRAHHDLEEANKSRVLFDQVKKFLADRSMIKYGAANRAARGGWEPSPCLLDDDKKQVNMTDEATVIRDKWSR